MHLLAPVGAQLPLDGGKNSSYVVYNLHAGDRLPDRLSLGLSYGPAITRRKDLMKQRAMFTATYELR